MATWAEIVRRLAPVHRLGEPLTWREAMQEAPGRLLHLPLGPCHLVEAGPESGEPLLLLHGFLYHSVMWAGVQPSLAARGARAVAVDLLGWGYSGRNESMRYDYALYARQVLQVMDALGWERATLVGHSMGGGAAIRFAVEHPERVARLILVDPASLPVPLARVGRVLAWPGVGEAALALGAEALLEVNLKRFGFLDPSRVTPGYVAAVAAPLRIEGSSWTLLNILRELDFGSQQAQVEALGALEIPTLILWGARDRAIPLRVGLGFRDLLPRARFVVIDGSGHIPHEERPEAFLEEVAAFLGWTAARGR